MIFYSRTKFRINEFAWDKEHLDLIIKKNIDLTDKRVIVVVPIPPWQKLYNFPKVNKEIEYLLIKLKK